MSVIIFIILYFPYSMREQKLSVQKLSNTNGFSTPNSIASCSSRVEVKKAPLITNFYIEQLKQIFTKKEQSKHNIQDLLNMFSKSQTHFIIQLPYKLSLDDCKTFINNLSLCERSQDNLIIEKGKKSQIMYILLQGQISYNIKSQVQQEQLIKIGTGYPGFLVYPQIFMTPRYVNFTIKCQRNSTFLTLSQQIYNKYLKKIIIRQVDTIANFFDEVPIFSGIGALNIRKYIPFFILRCFKYNEVIYSQGDDSQQIFFILRGEVQLYSKSGQSHINIVNLGFRQCFGLDIENNLRKYYAKSIDSQLKVFVLNKNVLQIMKNQNQCVQQNCKNYSIKKQKLHCSLINKNIKLLNNKDEIIAKITKRKKKKAKKNKNSLTWWGLAQNVKIEQKYKIPKGPQTKSTTKLGQDQKTIKTQLLTHKINKLKQRILQEQDVQQQCEQDQKQNGSPYKISNNYMPKIKRKIKMLEVKPKAIDMAQIIKKKLVTYARNMGSFCDRLNLE